MGQSPPQQSMRDKTKIHILNYILLSEFKFHLGKYLVKKVMGVVFFLFFFKVKRIELIKSGSRISSSSGSIVRQARLKRGGVQLLQ